jgi:hypothetical protein
MFFKFQKHGLKRSLPLIDNSRKGSVQRQFGFGMCVLVRQDEGGKQ